MKCESCDRDFPSVYYFRAKGICIDCYEKLDAGEKDETEPLYQPIPKVQIQKSKLVGFLRSFTTFILAVLILGGIGITLALVALMIDPALYRFDSFKDFNILFELEPVELAGQWQAISSSESLKDLHLTMVAALDFVFTDRIMIMLYFISKYIILAFTFTIFYKLRQILITLENREPFIRENARRIRWIGYSIIGISLAAIIVGGTILILMHDPFRLSGMQINTYWLSVYRIVADSISSIFWGFLVLLISEIFRQAVLLREDQELTV